MDDHKDERTWSLTPSQRRVLSDIYNGAYWLALAVLFLIAIGRVIWPHAF